MKKFAVMDAGGVWLFDIHADDAETALRDAQAHTTDAYRVVLVSEVDRGLH